MKRSCSSGSQGGSCTLIIQESVPKHAVDQFILLLLVVPMDLMRGALAVGVGGSIVRAAFG